MDGRLESFLLGRRQDTGEDGLGGGSVDVADGEGLAKKGLQYLGNGDGTKKTLDAIQEVAPLLTGGYSSGPLGIVLQG